MKALALAVLCVRPAPPALPAAAAPVFSAPALAAPSFASALLAAPSAVAPAPEAAPAPAASPAAEQRFYPIGALVADRRAPGATELTKALNAPEVLASLREDGRAFDGARTESHAWPLIGIFHVETARVLNGYSIGSFGVRGHSDALPPNVERSEHGGYTLFVRPDGTLGYIGSGALPADLTPRVRRAILRYYGLRAARETMAQRMKRLALRAWDGLLAVLHS